MPPICKMLSVARAALFGAGVAFACATSAAEAAPVPAGNDGPVYGPRLEGFTYPEPVHRYAFVSQRETVEMTYMDVQPAHPNGRTVVLLHGKNFCAATWEDTIGVLSRAGYRVIAPDQIGFCKSSKPDRYQYSFQQLARNTHALLESIGVKSATIVGHSTGGMLGMRYALMYPKATDQLVLVNPIGLEDWKALGVPPLSVDYWYARELKTTADGIRRYEQSTYYAGKWSPSYERWVQMLAGMYRGAGRDSVAWNSALIYDMILTQPVVYELGAIRVPTLLMIGDKDTTAIGKDVAPPDVHAKLGHYPELAKRTQAAIPGAQLVEFPALGHAPQIQDPDAFHKALLDGLAAVHPQ
ncbi:TPA: alpha/beta hydrolase [Burkholderia stabilis]|uniref:2-hydroxy-6-oxononadienedioate/2-hydroxy-6-oxon onatrienedioate hydrolase,haloalkane dehalogenase,3-oxoadipate enol-lactonase,Alpha/beta hydrolase family n=1 Tax=Burkholderia stabilis TaxID=95485 RepID=A0AAJ5N979_9BURK|nr:alpha/beta hydrolase [Burkholderia stabilis]VBB11180.1 2-hydroxy-6-oxononadienedioate/2-hydroxy-6-oxon onatrienedioate hydrolase,haloalkane dehalogenase,3-oxoadipate enol-lactonase,Alpha/beta hydrolase family [Burkholderia stabilis]HDR9586613.1 alpha/beta hydrolase [Burkholderia stabilis]HDR9650829.1 alpha/beta hydrolase [Burkholderia stabilis]HDR9656053.1 alpha/beta hydrolase [Burkholderia stabilis]HDR9681138.1 alpha/beta hydrolase [Burkholderia stabilis]